MFSILISHDLTGTSCPAIALVFISFHTGAQVLQYGLVLWLHWCLIGFESLVGFCNATLAPPIILDVPLLVLPPSEIYLFAKQTFKEITFCQINNLTKIPPGETGDNEAVDRFQGANQFRQEFPSLQFCRQKLWLSPLQQVDDGDEEEKSGDGDEDDIDDDGSGQGEKEDEAREDEEHAE